MLERAIRLGGLLCFCRGLREDLTYISVAMKDADHDQLVRLNQETKAAYFESLYGQDLRPSSRAGKDRTGGALKGHVLMKTTEERTASLNRNATSGKSLSTR